MCCMVTGLGSSWFFIFIFGNVEVKVTIQFMTNMQSWVRLEITVKRWLRLASHQTVIRVGKLFMLLMHNLIFQHPTILFCQKPPHIRIACSAEEVADISSSTFFLLVLSALWNSNYAKNDQAFPARPMICRRFAVAVVATKFNLGHICRAVALLIPITTISIELGERECSTNCRAQSHAMKSLGLISG